MKITVDTANDNVEEIKKVISFLKKIIGEEPEGPKEEAPAPEAQPAQQKPEPQQNEQFIQPAPVEESAQNPTSQQPMPSNEPQPAPANAPKAEVYGQEAASLMGMFNSEVPSNVPLNKLNQNQNMDDDDDDTENDLGLDIVPY